MKTKIEKKTNTSKSTPPSISTSITLEPSSLLVEALSEGHKPLHQLSPQDEMLFRAFQSNLLSLISHELRTPLMSILNSLNLLEDSESAGDFSVPELVAIARRNAQRLQQTLSALLDLAALESGTFHVKLREVSLERIAKNRLQAHESVFRDRGLVLKMKTEGSVEERESGFPLLADPQKLSRAIDLCLLALIPRALQASPVQVRISKTVLELQFLLEPHLEKNWDQAWSQALAGYQGGVAAPGSAFAGTMQSEQAFLTRQEEGLGSELILIHEIMKLHSGRFNCMRATEPVGSVTLCLELPALPAEEGLKAVLTTRANQASTDLSTVSLVLVEVPDGNEIEAFRKKMAKSLFRSTDAVYSLPERAALALVLDDCKAEDAPILLARLQTQVGVQFKYGTASCPLDGVDPTSLIALADERLESLGRS